MGHLEKRKGIILNALREKEEYITSGQLAALAGVSVRTIKSDIVDINRLLEPYEIKIKSTPNKGYCLEVEGNAQLADLNMLMDDSELKRFYKVPQNSNERVYYLIRKVLVIDYPLDMGELADEIAVSESTIVRDIQKVKEILAQKSLKLNIGKKGSIYLLGSELNKRIAISEFFFHAEKHSAKEENVFSEGLNKQEVEGIRIILRLVCKEFGIVLSDMSLSNLVIHVFIALTRYRFYNFIEMDEIVRKEYYDTIEYEAAKRLTQALEEAYDFVIPDDEIIYYAMHLKVKRIYDEIPLSEKEKIQINQCITECFEKIYQEYGIDFSREEELAYYLYQHIPLMIVRLKNSMSFRYPQVSEKPFSYLYSIKLTYIVSEIIERFYQVRMNAQELEYLVIYFCFALCKNRTEKKVRIGVYNGGGRAETVMYYNEICNVFHKEDYEVKIVGYRDLFPKGKDSVDICVSTCDLEAPLKKETVIIKNRAYIKEIHQAVYRHMTNGLNWGKYFKQWSVQLCLKGQNPEKILQNVEKVLLEQEIYSSEERPQFQFMEIGNGIVFLNDTGHVCREDFVFIGVLEKPVIWDMEVVRIVIIVDTVDHKNPDLSLLCYVLSKWMNYYENEGMTEMSWDYWKWMEYLRNPVED